MKLFTCALMTAMVMQYSCFKHHQSDRPKLKNGGDSISYYLGYYSGLKLRELGYSGFNKEFCHEAMQQVFQHSEQICSLKEADSIINLYFDKANSKQLQKTLMMGQAFLANNKKRKGVITTPSGVQYEILKEGSGIKPRVNDSILVLYKAYTIDNKVFMDHSSNGPEKILFTGNIPGLKEALQLMAAGSVWKIYLPAELAFGKQAVPGGIHKPNMAVIYEMELLTVIPYNMIGKSNIVSFKK